MAANEQDRIEMSWVVNAKPRDVLNAWISSEGHEAMTGAPAEVDGREGGLFTAWGPYIMGKTTRIDRRARKIVQTWRTLDFSPRAKDSRLEVEFRSLKGKTQVCIKHTKLQRGDGAKYTEGWYQHYLEPMQAHFGA